MPVVRWDPFREMMNVQDQLNRAFGSFLGERRSSWLPSVDVYDGKEEVVLKADLPGVTPADVAVELDERKPAVWAFGGEARAAACGRGRPRGQLERGVGYAAFSDETA